MGYSVSVGDTPHFSLLLRVSLSFLYTPPSSALSLLRTNQRWGVVSLDPELEDLLFYVVSE